MSVQLEEERARAELRARQGVGARYDAEAAPGAELLWARRGTAYLARKLNELTDEDLDRPGRDGASRRRVIARIAYQARALAQLIEGVRMGAAEPMDGALDAFEGEIVDAETLPAHALRYLFAHSEIHLNVEWRDLPNAGWRSALSRPSGWAITPADTVLLRARGVWGGAVALGDAPADLISALGEQVGRYWRARGLAADLVLGPAELARWLLGAGPADAAGLPSLPEIF